MLFIQEHDIKNYISLDDGNLYLGLGKRAITVSYKDEFFNKSCLEAEKLTAQILRIEESKSASVPVHMQGTRHISGISKRKRTGGC